MKWDRKISAGALQFVLFIGAVIAVLLIMFMLISHTHDLLNKKTEVTVKVIHAADYGITYLKSKDDASLGPEKIQYEGDIPINIEGKKELWGIFEKATSIASHGKTSYSKTALIGSRSKGMPALYLRDKQRPLIVAGRTKITGDVFLPERGIRMGNISGNSYSHQRLVYGNQKSSSKKLPDLHPNLLRHIEQLPLTAFDDFGETVVLERNMKVVNSFESQSIYIRGNIMRLEGIDLTGNITVVATDKIIVEPTAILKDVLLVAPEIIINDGVSGYFQAIALRSIHVGRNCDLAYPTALIVNGRSLEKKGINSNMNPNIHLDSNSSVKGILMYLDESDEQYYNPQIKIEENTIVEGEVYCEKNLELKGSVLGSVTTDGFVSLENGNIYQNHIYNGTIDLTGLSKGYSGLLYGNESPKKIVKWLY